jgi:pyruvate, water dikinase
MSYTIPFERLRLDEIAQIGDRRASLHDLVVDPDGGAVPRGFALSVRAFREHLANAGLSQHIYEALEALDPANLGDLARLSAAIRTHVRQAPLPAEVEQELIRSYQELSRSYGEAETVVAVRASATAEDLPMTSFAGQQESHFNVRGTMLVVRTVRDCMASLFTDRAIVYRVERGVAHRKVGLSVGVQKMCALG